MNNFKKILTTILFCIFISTFYISEANSINLNNYEIKTNTISKLIPIDNELLFYSDYTNNQITKFIKRKFSKNEIKKINMIKNGLISFFGFDMKGNFNEIYDGEFVLSTFKKPNKKREVLIIFKTKNKIDLNKILNIENNKYNVNQLVEISRPNTLNLITHVVQINNYIICSSNKDLILESLRAIDNNKITKMREEKFKYYETKLNNKKLFLYTNKQFYDFLNIKPFNLKDINYLTQFYLENNKLVLNSFSLYNNDDQLNKNNLNIPEKNNIILLANDINIYKDFLNSSVKNQVYKKLFEDITQTIKDKIFIKFSNYNWVMGFKKPINNFSIDQLTSLSDYHQDKFKNNNYIYTIFSKNNLKFLDQKIIYKSERPIFVYESNNLTFLSNDLSELLNTLDPLITDNILQSESDNLILDDKLIIRDFNNQIYKDFLNIFDSLNYFTPDGLSLRLDTFESNTKQKIPETIPSIQLKTLINFS
tara:strand:- start:195 stop:1631 length:1437 start_codon:yes stop_codon:yes gene_type:complete